MGRTELMAAARLAELELSWVKSLRNVLGQQVVKGWIMECSESAERGTFT